MDCFVLNGGPSTVFTALETRHRVAVGKAVAELFLER